MGYFKMVYLKNRKTLRQTMRVVVSAFPLGLHLRYCSHVHSNRQKSMKIAFVDGIFAHWPILTYGQRNKCADLREQ